MSKIESFVRRSVLKMSPYSSARDEFSGTEGIFLDANENPFGIYNRYPDPYQKNLKLKLSEIKNVQTENIFVGNGSDEVIDLAFRIFCQPQKDKVIVCPPTYGMYQVSAALNEIDTIEIPLLENFQLNTKKILQTKAKMIFICSPNNPTGNVLEDVTFIIENFDGIVFLDEAYIDFCKEKTLLSKLNSYPNLIISQTLSKAWGKAGLRIGFAFASKEIIDLFNKVKPPYNISILNQEAAIKTLNDKSIFEKNLGEIITEKQVVISALRKLNFVTKIYPSDANFLFIETTNANAIYEKLVEEKIIVRNRNSVVKNCLRVTIGTKEENKKLIDTLNKIIL